MENISRTPLFVANAELDEGPASVIDALALGPFLSGEQPWSRSKRLERVRPDARLTPPDTEPCCAGDSAWGRRVVLTRGPGWTLLTSRCDDREARLTVTASSDDLARTILDQATTDAVEAEPDTHETVTIGFWHLAATPRRSSRDIAIEPWPAIRRNYEASAAAALDRLMHVDSHALSGRLLLLHGPPGTGKTTTIRALADAWRGWCRFEYILDPEKLLRDPGYLLTPALGLDNDEDKRWRLLILEDCDELIRRDAKAQAGHALTRLLNLTDGILGQGLEVVVCITTNEDLSSLHPAIVRPGRCMAQVYTGRLPFAQAAAWLGTTEGVGPDGATLAELFALRGRLDQVSTAKPEARVGQYL